jgi:hypothetical protein
MTKSQASNLKQAPIPEIQITQCVLATQVIWSLEIGFCLMLGACDLVLWNI